MLQPIILQPFCNSFLHYTNGASSLNTTEKICQYGFGKGEKEIQKRVKQILASLKSDWTVLVQDESIFVYDYVVKLKK